MPLVRERVYTVEVIYALPEGQRAELIDGVIIGEIIDVGSAMLRAVDDMFA